MNVNIIDADSILYITTYNKKGADIKTSVDCIEETDRFLNTLLKMTGSTHYLLYLTVGESFRKNYYTDYKDNRKNRVKPDFFDNVREHLLSTWKAVYHKGLEADDLCLITKKNLESRGIDCFISSPDKDILNLEGTHYDYRKNKWVDITEEQAKIYFWSTMITGDIGDNIKGIPGMGDKTVLRLFNGVSSINLPSIVFNQYISIMGDNEGIEEFHKNYRCLKILSIYDNFEIPLPIEFKQEEYDSENKEITP